jgi:hypothetical protein
MTVKITKPNINIREKLTELDRPIGIAGEAMIRAESPRDQQELIGVRGKNILINGDFQISQRGDYSSATSVSGGNYYLDRWTSVVSTINPTITHTNVQIPTGQTVKSIKITATAGTGTGTGYCQMRQKIEHFNHLKGQYLTLSCWFRTSKSDNSSLHLAIYDNGSAAGWIKGDILPNDGLWHFVTFTMKMSETINAYPEITIQDNSMWQVGEYYEVALMQLELGKVATPFEHRGYGEELALCQRYGCRLGADQTDDTGHYNLIGSGWWRDTTAVPYNLQIQAVPPVPLRHKDYTASVLGTNTFYMQSGGQVGNATFYSINNPGSSPTMIWLDFTASTAAVTNGQAAAVSSDNNPAVANAIFIDAEL